MKKRSNNIFFKPISDYADKVLNIPKPSISYIPSWYRNEKLFSNGENNWLKANKKSSDFSGTYKLCVPVTDSLTAGYMLVTSADVVVQNSINNEKYFPNFYWKTQNQIMDFPEGSSTKSLGGYPIPHGYANSFTRWHVDWHIKTPPGYSLWVTHPSHRYDLPFLTINGLIDTDKHPNSLKLPFFIREGFEGIIPSNTPIAQIIPIKRDTWISKKSDYDPNFSVNAYNMVAEKIVRTYKEKWWSKKYYG
jgi:hypothetical protein